MGRNVRRVILASHLVFNGYGTWLSNDPRGSGSESIRKDELKDLGGIHHGRKRVQPPREELRAFYKEAEPLLEHETMWFRTERARSVVANAVGRVAKEQGYTLWACAVCSNHAHAVARTHRDRAETIWQRLADGARDALCARRDWRHRIIPCGRTDPTKCSCTRPATWSGASTTW